jgi:PAS domain S-box-containing protein
LLELDYRGQAHVYTDEEIALTQTACRLIALIIEREQLLVTNQRLSELIESAHDAVLVRDPESRILFWNQGAEHLYGWTKQEAMGNVTHTLFATQFPLAHETIDSDLARDGQWEGVLTHTRRDGETVIVESRQVLTRDGSGKISSILEINRDITERERLARERVEAQATEQALREANRLMDEFIGIAGHELRTPLTTIKASVQLAKRQIGRLLKQDGLPASLAQQLSPVQGHLDRTERQIAMQNRLVSDLLDVSRIHSGHLELHPDLCDLVALVREVVEDQRYLTPERKLDVLLVAPEEILVLADADRIRQVVSNYLSNALKYSEALKPVAVSIEIIGMQVRVSVRDEGPGLSLEQQQYVWERFYRVPGIEVRTGSGVGLGLGLHISRMIIERQRGQVGIESEQGRGSTFWFMLPVAETI